MKAWNQINSGNSAFIKNDYPMHFYGSSFLGSLAMILNPLNYENPIRTVNIKTLPFFSIVFISQVRHLRWSMDIIARKSDLSKLQIPCKKSIYLMITIWCDTKNLSITQFQFFNKNIVISYTLYIVYLYFDPSRF